MAKSTCKLIVAPHIARGPRATSRRSFQVDDAGWRDAIDHAQTGDSTVYLVCKKTKVRMATCTENNKRTNGALCRIDVDFSAKRKRKSRR